MRISGPLLSKGFIVGSLLVCCLLGACSKKTANSELEKATTMMAQPEPAQPAAAPEPVQQATAGSPTPAPPLPKNPAQEMSQAMAAYKSGDLDDAIRRLQQLRTTPVMSPEKRIAVNDAIAAVMSEIYAMAEKGDSRAIQAVKTYETLQSRPR